MYLNLEQAAEELNIPDNGMNVLLQLGRIRYTIPKSAFEHLIFADEDDVTCEHLEANQLPKELVKYGLGHSPKYLYHSSLLIYLANATSGMDFYLTPTLEEFDGTELRLLNQELGFAGMKLPLTSEGLVENALFTQEELMRYQTSNNFDCLLFKGRSSYSSVAEPFDLPQRADDPCRAIVEMGNLYFKKHQVIPQPAALRKFMIHNKETHWQVIDKPNNERKMIEIEDHPMSYDSFNKRYQQYLGG